ncbi:MAG: hybrid sensor histidine kinase/response regulator [Chloroflexota bacterium]|nr:hybrid sensor histidine kinase/response regulator [Chloroflexota bacterium]
MIKNKRILTIDDSAAIRSYLQAILTPQGASVDVTGTGREGLDMCTGDERYDLILLDLILPDLNGIEVLERIRQEDDETTVVILTGAGGIKSAIAAVRRGADAYVEKQDIAVGSDLTEFFYILEHAIEHRAGLVAQRQLHEVRADFYSIVTHDLRSPANGILTATQLLLEEAIGPTTPDQADLFRIIQQEVSKMLKLINDYLDFAKINAGYLHISLSDVELGKIVEESTLLIKLQSQSKNQTLTLDLPPHPVTACADAELLLQVLDNLLSNAIKYTPEGGHITVQLRVEDGQAVFRISDTGMGIPPAQLPALFTKYHRLPGEATVGIHGTGLGLLIVKEIVEAHGGTVRAESEDVQGKGATFIVRIPLEPVAE